MWQIYAMMAKDQIDEQLHEAELRRRSEAAVRASRRQRRPLPAQADRDRPARTTR